MASRGAEARETLEKAGLAATNLTVTADGRLIVPDGSLKFADPVIENVANAKSDDISQVAATQLKISKQYYENVLRQGRASFRWAFAAAAAGPVFFIAAVGFALATNKVNAAIISAIGPCCARCHMPMLERPQTVGTIVGDHCQVSGDTDRHARAKILQVKATIAMADQPAKYPW